MLVREEAALARTLDSAIKNSERGEANRISALCGITKNNFSQMRHGVRPFPGAVVSELRQLK